MTYLVTGGTGLIGSRVVRDLVKQGERVVVYDSQPQDSLANLLTAEELKSVVLVRGDIVDLPNLLHAVKDNNVQKIIHLAAMTTYPSSQNPPLAIRVNCEGTANVFEAGRLFGLKKIVWASTRDVFGTEDKYPGGVVPNDGAHYPASVYAATKSFGEVLAQHYIKAYGLDIAALRYFFAYGIGQRGSIISHFMRELVENPATGKPGRVPFGDDSFGWLYVDDAARATVMLSQAGVTKSKAFTVAARVHPVKDAVAYVRKLIPGSELEILPGKLGPGNKCDTRPLLEEVGFEPRWSMEDGLKDAVEQVRRQHPMPPLPA